MKDAAVTILFTFFYIAAAVWAHVDAPHSGGCRNATLLALFPAGMLVEWLILPTRVKRWLLQ